MRRWLCRLLFGVVAALMAAATPVLAEWPDPALKKGEGCALSVDGMVDRVEAWAEAEHGPGSLMVFYSEQGYYRYVVLAHPDGLQGMHCKGLVRITPGCEVEPHSEYGCGDPKSELTPSRPRPSPRPFPWPTPPPCPKCENMPPSPAPRPCC